MKKELLIAAGAAVFASASVFAKDGEGEKNKDGALAGGKLGELAAAEGEEKTAEEKPMTLEEATKYFSRNAGVYHGTQIKADEMLDVEEFMKGLQEALDGKADAKDIEQAKMGMAQQIIQEAMVAKMKKKGADFLAENKTKEGVKVTESGLQYKVIKAGEGDSPTPADQVKVHYTGKLLSGDVFDSSVERGEPVTFGVTQVIRGWVEGLQLMKPGAKYEFYIPSELAYGAAGSRGSIPPHAVLTFEVELLEVIKPAAPEPKEDAPPAKK